MDLSIAIITSRTEPHIQWALDSLKRQFPDPCGIEVIVVSLHTLENAPTSDVFEVKYVKPKPNVWQGEFRKTPSDWWAKPSSINTFLCLARHEFVLMLDDRCVIQDGFADAVKAAMAGRYIMCGSYEKRTDMVVENGVIVHAGTVIGTDHRSGAPSNCSGQWMFGCVTLAPLDWWLGINGSPEKCNGLGFEDAITGILFDNANRPMNFDSRAKIIEDRTVGGLLGDKPMHRESKERHPHDSGDKAHTLLRWARAGADRSDNDFDIRQMRLAVEKGDGFPSVPEGESFDWFDNQPLSEMK